MLLKDQQARLTSIPLVADRTQCFSFWYNIKYEHNSATFYAMALVSLNFYFQLYIIYYSHCISDILVVLNITCYNNLLKDPRISYVL